MIRIPKTLADVLSLAGFEEVHFEWEQEGGPFRCWSSPDLTARLFVFDRAESRCVWHFLDEADGPHRGSGGFEEATRWAAWRPEYREALLVRFAS